jgi:hydroxymethylpyrimidine kinase/phosphomethylpyrimidine kinase/thiamine-phosphate diphosphorylase
MRVEAPMQPTILTIAGSDSSGGAGIQADLKAIAANGGYGASVIAAITAQNTLGVTAVAPVDTALVEAQLEAVLGDLRVDAVKTGMLLSPEVVGAVTAALRRHRPPVVVCDPVMISKTGHLLLEPSSVEALRRDLLPLSTVVTPNAHEAGALTGVAVDGEEAAIEAGRRLLALGPGAVLVKGGHLPGDEAVDVLVTGDGVRRFPGARLHARHTHGTGCTLAAALATQLGHGVPLVDAVAVAKRFVTEAIRHGLAVGGGIGPTDPFFFLHPRSGRAGTRWLDVLYSRGSKGRGRVGRLHVLTDETIQDRHGHAELARLAAEGGADTVQLREKRFVATDALVRSARAAAQATGALGATVLVNDRADVAAASGAGGVHLGGDDLSPAWARRLLGETAWIGGTANSLEEALRVAAEPVDYLGVGPVFGTGSKRDPAPVLGLELLRRIVEAVDKPVIAIGGLTPDRVAPVLDAGAHGLAVLSAVVADRDPRAAARAFREAVEAWDRERVHA